MFPKWTIITRLTDRVCQHSECEEARELFWSSARRGTHRNTVVQKDSQKDCNLILSLLPQFERQAHRNDANGILKKKVRDQKAAVEEIIKMIGNL